MPSTLGRTRSRGAGVGNRNCVIPPTGRTAGAQGRQGGILDRLGEMGAVGEPYSGDKVDVEDGWPVRAGVYFGLLVLLRGRGGEVGGGEIRGGGYGGGGGSIRGRGRRDTFTAGSGVGRGRGRRRLVSGVLDAEQPDRVRASIGGSVAVEQIPHGLVQMALAVFRHCQQRRGLGFRRRLGHDRGQVEVGGRRVERVCEPARESGGNVADGTGARRLRGRARNRNRLDNNGGVLVPVSAGEKPARSAGPGGRRGNLAGR